MRKKSISSLAVPKRNPIETVRLCPNDHSFFTQAVRNFGTENCQFLAYNYVLMFSFSFSFSVIEFSVEEMHETW